MRPISEESVFLKSYDLYRMLHEAIKKYPKGDRHSLGERTAVNVLELIKSITKACYAKKEWKVPHIDQAIVAHELAKVHVRLANDTKCLDQRQYVAAQDRLQEIGRMLGGWKNSV